MDNREEYSVDFTINHDEFDTSISDMQKQAQALARYIKKINQTPFTFMPKNALENVKKAKIEYADIMGTLSQHGKQVEENEEEEKAYFGFLQSGIADGIRQIKRFTFALLGVRGVFGAVSRAVRTSLANNVELSNKFNAVWQALGYAITPVVEKLVNAFLTLANYINIFFRAATGIDLLAKAMAQADKNTKKTSKSVKQLKTQLAGFDDLNNLNDNNSGSAGGAGLAWQDAFKNLDMTWADKIESWGKWVGENWQEIAKGLGLIAAAVLLFDTVGPKATAGITLLVGGLTLIYDGLKKENVATVTAGFAAIGGAITMFTGNPKVLVFTALVAGVIAAIGGLRQTIEGIQAGNLKQIADGLNLVAGGITAVGIAVAILTKNPTVAVITTIVAAVLLLASTIIRNWDSIKAVLATIGNWINTNVIQPVANFFRNLWTGISNGAAAVWQGIRDVFSGIGKWFSNLWSGISNTFKTVCNGLIGFVEGVVNGAIKGINKIIKSLNKLSFDIPSWVPVIGGKKFGFNFKEATEIKMARLDVGTNYVPNDQLAMIHQGEAVIPKKFNSEQYFNNAEQTDLLKDILEAINDGKNITLNIDGKRITKEITRLQGQNSRLLGGHIK